MKLSPFRTAAVAVLGALAGAALIVVTYARAPELVISMDTDPPPVVQGLYPIERDPTGRSFAWTREAVTLELPGLDRQHAWSLWLRFRGARPDTASLPEMTIDVDGVTRATHRARNEFLDVRVPIPPSQGRLRGLRVAIRASNTFVPGPGDPRPLGFVIDELRIVPSDSGVPIVPTRALAAATLAGMVLAAALALIGLTPGSAVMGAVVLAAGQAAAITIGAGPYSAYVERIPWLAVAISAALVALVGIGEWRWKQPLRNTARFAAAFTAGVLYLELIVLLHPNMPIGDALFQAHRFEWVKSGRLLFTSIAPGQYEFPYAIGLYVCALPFSAFVHGTLGYMAMLRVIVSSADAVAGLLLYPVVARATGNRLAAAFAVAAYHVVPLQFGVLSVGNLTNAFGQALFVTTLAGLAAMAGLPMQPLRVAALTMVAAAAMLSHTSTFAVLLAVLVCAALLFRVRGDREAKSLAVPTLVIAAGATVIAVALYYAHFSDTYASQMSRIFGELQQPAAASDPAGRSIGTRAALVPHYLRVYYGWPLLVLAVGGFVAVARERRALPVLLVAWLGACAVLMVVGILTPIDLRHYLAAFPAIALLAAFGAARWWRQGPVAQSAAAVLLGAAVVIAVRSWLSPLT